MLRGLESRTEPAALTVNRIGRRTIMCMLLIAVWFARVGVMRGAPTSIANRSDRNVISVDPFLREVALHIFLLLHQQADIARPLGYPVRLAAERLRRTLKVVRPLIERNPFSRPRTQPRRFYRPALISSVRVSDVSTEVFWCVPETETIDAQRRLSGI